ncbi:MAG TPA: thioredoxin family protein [Terriglobia bacterium]|nr:thioredoxin family protein [Terriglobia bacterium]
MACGSRESQADHFLRAVLALAQVQPTNPAVPTAALYDESADAARVIRAAVRLAARGHRNIVLVFGANWCGDCRALDREMRQPDLASLIERNYVVVKIDVGRRDKNLELGDAYHVPVKDKGIPALAVLDPNGKLLHAQAEGEFADAGRMEHAAFQAFFEQWKPKGPDPRRD